VPRVPAPGATLKILAGGSIVRFEQFVLEKATLAVVAPLMDTQATSAWAAVRDVGILNWTARVAEPELGSTLPDCTLTAEPLPGDGVIVTVTPLGAICPVGNPLPMSVTAVNAGGASAGVAAALSVTCADAKAALARKRIEKDAARPIRLNEDTLHPRMPTMKISQPGLPAATAKNQMLTSTSEPKRRNIAIRLELSAAAK
jgi:hypothetical protein